MGVGVCLKILRGGGGRQSARRASKLGTSIPRGVRNVKSRNCYFPRFEGEIFPFLIVCWKEQFYELPSLGIPNTGEMKL